MFSDSYKRQNSPTDAFADRVPETVFIP